MIIPERLLNDDLSDILEDDLDLPGVGGASEVVVDLLGLLGLVRVVVGPDLAQVEVGHEGLWGFGRVTERRLVVLKGEGRQFEVKQVNLSCATAFSLTKDMFFYVLH